MRPYYYLMANYQWYLSLILGKDKIKIKPLTTGPISNVLKTN